ncbi:site-specific DNA-methyltransferase [Prevotella amnii]|uniref:site-specific DNA-methyltransferase n=1 Tax=Prevotella amnii TaxID=419005 RepID=UPI0003628322|nr:site-specific DNA-methyltransferase [Prevotella amnii]
MKPIRIERTSANGSKLNLEALYQIAPSCFTEEKDEKTGTVKHVVNFKTLRQILGDDAVEDSEEMYQFTWPGKQAARYEAATPIADTLRPVTEDSVDWDTTENLYIEGDNLRVLKLLQKSYMGKVKMIYIDPPYNTGNDFVYHDDFKTSLADEELAAGNIDEEGLRYRKNLDGNGRFHSDWCSMMYSRLLVARSLLTEDGVIFISIDDHEVHNLRKICDEVLGAGNFVAEFVWVNSLRNELEEDTKFAGANLGKLKKSHEYVLAYKKNNYSINLDRGETLYIDKLITNGGNNISQCLIKKGVRCVENITKTITGHVGGTKDYYNILSEEGMLIVDGVLQNDVLIEGPLRNPITLSRYFAGEEVIDRKGQRLIEVYLSTSGMLHTRKERAGNTPASVLVGKGTTKRGTLLLEEILGGKFFDYVKPIELLKYLVDKVEDKKALILDFFSGSATTAHAVMKLNAEDGGKRKYICVQLAEETPEQSEARKAGYKNICEIGKERIRRAGKKIKEETPLSTQHLDTGFRVFRLDGSNYEDVTKQPGEYDQRTLDLFANNIKADRTDLDLLFGAMLSWGVQLSLPMTTEEVDGCKIYTVDDGGLVACFAENITENVAKAMADKLPVRVLFRDSCFGEDKTKINIFELFKQKLNWDDKEAKENIRVV